MSRSPLHTIAVLTACTLMSGLAAANPDDANKLVHPRLDVAFILDTTGSMGDEIDVVKEKLVSIAHKLEAGQPSPDVRFAVVAYRDKGDAYLTKTFDFERDVKKVQTHIMGLTADGGGDEPEDVAAAMHAALKLSWDNSPSVARVAFLVGDAGPHAYKGEPTWEHATTNFKERQISVDTIGCSGLNSWAKGVFQNIAERTSGKFEELTYSRVVASAGGRKSTVLTSGGASYVADGEISEKDWKEGAEALVAKGRAKKATAADAAIVYAPPAAMAPAPTNNLDTEIGTRLMDRASAAGTAYAK